MVFLADFGEEAASESVVSGWFELRIAQFVRIRVDRSVQSVALVAESDHGLVDRDVIRRLSGFGL